MTSREYRQLSVILLVIAVAGLLLPLTAPALHRVLGPAYPVCRMQEWTGHACPLCGLTRAFGTLWRGHATAALAYHPLSLVFAALLVGEALLRTVILARRWSPGRLAAIRRVDRRVHSLAAGLYLGYCIAFLVCPG